MKMLKITDKYSLDADRYGYVLVKHSVSKKTGEPVDKVEGYVNNLHHAMDLIYRIETRKYIKEHDVELKEATKAFREIWDEIQKWGNKQ